MPALLPTYGQLILPRAGLKTAQYVLTAVAFCCSGRLPVGLRAARAPIPSQITAAVGSWLLACAKHAPASSACWESMYKRPRPVQTADCLGLSCRALQRAYSLVAGSQVANPRTAQSSADAGSSRNPPTGRRLQSCCNRRLRFTGPQHEQTWHSQGALQFSQNA